MSTTLQKTKSFINILHFSASLTLLQEFTCPVTVAGFAERCENHGHSLNVLKQQQLRNEYKTVKDHRTIADIAVKTSQDALHAKEALKKGEMETTAQTREFKFSSK